MIPINPAASPAVALRPALSLARVATLTSLAMLSAAARRPAVATAAALPACPRTRDDDPRCAGCPFARPSSQ